MTSAENLSQEDPQSYQRRINAFVPRTVDRVERLLNCFARKDVSERVLATLQELLLEKIELTSKQSLVTIPHSWASLPLMNLRKRGPSCICHSVTAT